MAILCLVLLCICTFCIDGIWSNNNHSHHKIHKCSHRHDTIIKGETLFQQQIPYKNHPYSIEYNTSMERRSLLSESDVSPIRISAYYDPITFVNALTSSEQAYIKQLIGAATDYYTKAASVIPVDGTLFIDRFCTNFWDTSYGKVCSNYAASKCFGMDIPSSHLSEQYLFDDSGGRTVLSGGLGISSTDLLIYVTADPSTSSCGSTTTLAHGGACVYDQYGRPIAGNINICAHFHDSYVWKEDVATILHEMSHITIMNSVLWTEFKDTSGNTIPVDQVLDTTVSPQQIITPIVVSKAKDHFNCRSVRGLPLDIYGTSHWNERYVFAEIMNADINSVQMYYTEFTLALMEDSGWYLVNYEYAEPFAFGKNAGCHYFNGDCIDKMTHTSNFPQYYCDSLQDNGCNSDYSNPSGCYLSQFSSIPPEYQYFVDPTLGGNQASDFCPMRLPYSNRDVCWDITSSNTASFGEVWSSTSRCSNVKSSGNGYGFCFQHSCYGWDGTKYDGADIVVSDKESVSCTRADAFTVKTLRSLPNGELICPDIDIVCGTAPHFGACYWGHYSDIFGKCICSPAYKGNDCNTVNDAVNIDLTQPTDKASTTVIEVASSVCFQDWNDYNMEFNGEWSKTGTYYDLGIYTNVKYYLYFKASQSAWWIAPGFGTSLYCRCSVSLFTQNIDECNGNWYCYTGEYTLVSNAKISSGSCITVSASRSIQDDASNSPFGIVLGCTLGVLLFIAIICCLYKIQKQKKMRNESMLLSQLNEIMDVEPHGSYAPPQDK